ncbi:hypothetical protein [Massilia sp.]|uniref:hypothetical protein n=1 Tax=Massilia sp. TaxID=1882437 RepID=UPI00352BF0D3
MSEQETNAPAPKKPNQVAVRKTKLQGLGEEAFQSPQLSLFQNFLANTPSERDKLSNTIALWDSIPRYSISRSLQYKLRTEHGTLELLKLNFRHNKQDYLATITPARIEIKDGPDKGKTVDYYPSATEEIVEDVLRKMAADQEQQQGFFDKKGYVSGVAFSLYQLREELSKLGHTRSYSEIVLSLEILHKTNIQITTTDGREEQVRSSTYFPAMGTARRKDIDADPSARWGIQFHPLVTRSIDELTYRQFNYHQLMSHRSQLTRWIHKQLVMKFTFAEIGGLFKMKFSTIKRDSALLTGYKQDRQAVVAVAESFEELKKSGLLMDFEKGNETRGPRNKFVDVEFILTPSITFVREVRAANKRRQLAGAQDQTIVIE